MKSDNMHLTSEKSDNLHLLSNKTYRDDVTRIKTKERMRSILQERSTNRKSVQVYEMHTSR
jgi:hypothetical protein